MLNILRKRAQSTVIQAMVLLIAVVFVFWGVGSNLNNNRNAVAVVNGEEIPYQTYQKAYERTVDEYQQRFGGQIPPGLLDGLNLKGQVLGQLIQAELLRQGAAKMGLAISKEATQREITRMQAFQENGSFNLGRYKEVLSQNHMTPTSFEGGLRNDLLTSHVVDTIESFALLPETEVQRWLEFSGEEQRLGLQTIDSTSYEDKVEIKDDELAAWFAQHKEEYKSEPKIRLKYLLLPFAKDLSEVHVSNDALKARYEKDISTYQQPEERHARHILLKVTAQDDEQTVAAKKKQAEDILGRIRQGEDFATLAEEFSEGPTKTHGGDLGFFSRGRMVKAFDDAVFSLQPGSVSEPVRTSFGFHLIKVEEVRPAITRSFAEMKEELAEKMKQEEVKGITFKKASTAYEDIMRAGSIDKYSSQGAVPVHETDFFIRSQPPAGIPADSGFLQAAFGLRKGELSSLVELQSGYAILYVDDVEEPLVPELTAVRERVEKDFRRERAVDLASEAAEKILAAAKEQGKLTAKDMKETGYIKRVGSQNDIAPAEVTTDAFSLAPTAILPEKPIRVDNKFYLYEVRDRRQSGAAIDEAKKKQLAEQLLSTQQNKLVGYWLADLRQEAEIWTNDKLLQ